MRAALYPICHSSPYTRTMATHAVAGLGIVRKIDSLAYAVNQGITQGMLPLVAYSYAAGDRERSEGSEHYTEKEIEKMIRRIDRDRARYYADSTDQKWGDKQYYDLCINTTGKDIKALVPHLARML